MQIIDSPKAEISGQKPRAKRVRAGFLACLLTVLVGCSSSGVVMRADASEYPRQESYALPIDVKTSLGSAISPLVHENGGLSGFYLLTNGASSFEMRLAMIEAAEKTLDIQYYLMNNDDTANVLLQAILRAAARGVRVRFLLDSLNVGDVEPTLAVLDNYKNIEIRVFNPMTTRDQSLPSRLAGLFTDVTQATKRMHNKVLAADNQLAIIGGRNLGNEYFDADQANAFSDVDVLSAGPVTDRISKSFDKYWNSKEAFPLAVVRAPVKDQKKVADTRAKLAAHWDAFVQRDEGKKLVSVNLANLLASEKLRLTWAAADLAVDDPRKVSQETSDAQSPPLNSIARLAADTRKEFIIVSAYFVPQDMGVDWLADIVNRGVGVKVLTNSLSSTDVVAVHAGYERYRRDLVDHGVELYELKHTGNKRPRQRLFGSQPAAEENLHSKVYIFDRKEIVVGSFNLDPRSVERNTEITLIIHSEVLAQQLARLFDETIQLKNSYHVISGKGTDGLYWDTEENGVKKRYDKDPKAGVGRKIQTFITSMLPVEDQL